MKILVTGANGFTGKHFTAEAIKQHHEVAALNADICELADLKEEVSAIKPDAVMHLAAVSFVGHQHAEDFYKTNVIGTENLFKAISLLEKKPRTLIASSANVYGNPQVDIISERLLPAPINHYAISKLSMELMAKIWFDDIPIIIARPFNYTGVGQNDSFLIPKLVSHYARRDSTVELGNIHVSRDFSDVKDTVNAYIKLLESSARSLVVNICSGQSTSIADVISHMDAIAGYHINVKVNPLFVRKNEIIHLKGDNSLLKSTIGAYTSANLKNTLEDMYNHRAKTDDYQLNVNS